MWEGKGEVVDAAVALSLGWSGCRAGGGEHGLVFADVAHEVAGEEVRIASGRDLCHGVCATSFRGAAADVLVGKDAGRLAARGLSVFIYPRLWQPLTARACCGEVRACSPGN